MKIKGITDEDFVNYRAPSMFIATNTCSMKCDKENGSAICQNSALAHAPTIDIPIPRIIQRYINNPITKAIVFGGLEPLDQPYDILEFIWQFRSKHGFNRHDDIVIYTGYTKAEIDRMDSVPAEMGYSLLDDLNEHDNIIIKYGRYIPGQPKHYDETLGVWLSSDNQYAEKLKGVQL